MFHSETPKSYCSSLRDPQFFCSRSKISFSFVPYLVSRFPISSRQFLLYDSSSPTSSPTMFSIEISNTVTVQLEFASNAAAVQDRLDEAFEAVMVEFRHRDAYRRASIDAATKGALLLEATLDKTPPSPLLPHHVRRRCHRRQIPYLRRRANRPLLPVPVHCTHRHSRRRCPKQVQPVSFLTLPPPPLALFARVSSPSPPPSCRLTR